MLHPLHPRLPFAFRCLLYNEPPLPAARAPSAWLRTPRLCHHYHNQLPALAVAACVHGLSPLATVLP